MKFQSLVSPALVVLTVIFSFVVAFVIAFPNSWGDLLASVGFGLVAFLLLYAWFRNAFRKFYIDSAGIRNRHCQIPWEEIQEISIYPVLVNRISIFPTISFPSIVCFSREKQSARSFRSLNPSCCVFCSMTPKHLQALQSGGKGRSQKLDAFFDRYVDFSTQP